MRLVILALVVACASKPAAVTSDEGDAAPFVAKVRAALVGRKAPVTSLEMLDGSRVDLASVIGKRPVYLKFWATWCKPCREQMPHLEATYKQHGDKLAVFAVDVGINDPIEAVRALVTERQLTLPVAYDRDGALAEAYQLGVTPQHVLIDRSGVIRYVGHAVTPQLEQAIASVIAATPPASAALAAAAPAALSLALDDGRAFTLAGGKPVALTFVTLWCDTYIAETRPEMGKACAAHARALEAAHQAHPELTWVVVSIPVWTDGEDIGAFRKRLGVSAPVGIDRTNAWFRKFGVRDVYTTIALDANGAELGRVAGDGADLAALVERALR